MSSHINVLWQMFSEAEVSGPQELRAFPVPEQVNARLETTLSPPPMEYPDLQYVVTEVPVTPVKSTPLPVVVGSKLTTGQVLAVKRKKKINI